MSLLNNATVTTAAEKQTAATEAARQNLKAERDAALQAMVYTFADGRKIQTRPQDEGNIRKRIAQGADNVFMMEDNMPRLTTVAEYEAALNHGLETGEGIWTDYIAAVAEL